MLKLTHGASGRHFLQIPGPTNVPDRVMRAMDNATIDHRGPEFQVIGKKVLSDLKKVFQSDDPVVIYGASGTGAWEAALVNTLSAGDKVLMYETGHFATLWKKMSERLGLRPEFIAGDWRQGVEVSQIAARLDDDKQHEIKAVCIVHNETSTGVTADIAAVRRAIDSAKHPALLMVDTISSLASIDYRHSEWGVDVTVAGSQKGLMLPPGLSFNAASEKAIAASKTSNLPKSYWAWGEILEANKNGFWPYTPSTTLLYGLSEACDILLEQGLPNVFARHTRFAQATRRAVAAWGLEVFCANPQALSSSLTAVMMPEGHDADKFRKIVLDNFDMSLGVGLAKLAGKVFRIGHLGDFNELMLMGTLAGVEMGLALSGVPHKPGGVNAAMNHFVETRKS
ncbi:MAG: aminotransferase class V-fold PLP-dependent enzyme [Comamonadaceae bacterium]